MLICIHLVFKVMVRDLDKEYKDVNVIYQRQKKYRTTDLGKQAIRRANERQTLKKMHKISNVIECNKCTESKFERLTIYNNKILCYSCRWERPEIFKEIIRGEL